MNNTLPNIKTSNIQLKPASSSIPEFSKERTELPELGAFKAPPQTIQCKTCRYRYPDPYGYRNGNCYKYKKESGKPNDILFDNAKCIYYRKDRSEETK